MAQEVIVTYTCDMQKHAAKPVEAVEMGVRVQLGGAAVDLDLCAACAKDLFEVFDSYLTAGQKVPARELRSPLRGRGVRSSHRTSRGLGDLQRPQDIREWAKSQGMPVKERGRIPAELEAAYAAAVGG